MPVQEGAGAAGAAIRTRRVQATRAAAYDVMLADDLAGSRAEALARLVEGRRVPLVSTPTVGRLHARALYRDLLARGVQAGMMELAGGEVEKTLDAVARVCERAMAQELDREALLVGVGGGVCTDVVTMAASWIRRGIGHVRVPTTLLGQVDASIGIKGGVNFAGKKNYLGCFHPPRAVLVDPCFLRTLPAPQVRYGLAEIVKVGVAWDAPLFELVEGAAHAFGPGGDPAAVRETVWRAIVRLLDELEGNLYEDRGYRRVADFGHTFSPMLESAAGFAVHHGDAVAVDMALSAVLAAEIGMLDRAECTRIVRLLRQLGLPVTHPLLTPERCVHALRETALHRGGSVNLVVPVAVGRAAFIASAGDVDPRALARALALLAATGAPAGAG
jgi:3-dehydroquinate synthase